MSEERGKPVAAEPPRIFPGRGPGPGGLINARINAEKPKDTRGTLLRLLKILGSNRYILLGLLCIMLITTLADLANPALQGRAIDAITVTGGHLAVDMDGLVRILAVMGLLFIAAAGLNFAQGWISAALSQKTVRRIRRELFAKIETLPIRYFDTHQHGDIMSRMTNDVENISNTLSQSVVQLFSGIISIVGSLIMMLIYSPLLTLVAIITIPLTIVASGQVVKHTRKYYSQQQRLLGNINGQIEEMVTGFKTVAANTRETTAVSQFAVSTAELKKTGIKAQLFGGIMGPLMNVIGNFSFLLVAVCGGYLAFAGAITVGAIQAFLQYSRQFTRPINMIANQYTMIQSAIAGAERVFEIMDAEPEPDAGKIAFDPANVSGNIAFSGVKFGYVPGQTVLHDFTLNIRPGEKIAFVGATGAGKTTVANLLTRFYDIQAGSIMIDGVDIREIPKAALRESIAIVLQDTVLFSGTIRDNILFGRPDATAAEVTEAAKTANADIFIRRMKDGYDTPLAEAAENLSEGQRQLLSIARAVLKDPRILILDEATSSIDTRTEMHIQSAMIALMKNRTSIIIAHRLSTIRDADRIVVISDGRIAETGSHEELLSEKGIYWNLYKNQFAGMQT